MDYDTKTRSRHLPRRPHHTGVELQNKLEKDVSLAACEVNGSRRRQEQVATEKRHEGTYIHVYTNVNSLAMISLMKKLTCA
jgi:hypothetical protein